MAKYTINPKPVTKPRKDGQNQSYFEFTTEEGKTYNAPVKAKVTTPEGTVITLAEAQADANVRREFVEALVAEHYANVQKGIQAQADKLASMTDADKEAYKERQRQAGLAGAAKAKADFEALSDADKEAYKERQRQAGLKGAAKAKAAYDAMSDEDKAAYKAEQSRQGKAAWEAKSPEEKEAHRQQSIQNNIQNIIKVDDSFQL